VAQALKTQNSRPVARVKAAQEMTLRVEMAGYGGVPLRAVVPGEALSGIERGTSRSRRGRRDEDGDTDARLRVARRRGSGLSERRRGRRGRDERGAADGARLRTRAAADVLTRGETFRYPTVRVELGRVTVKVSLGA
jgi:hypothetical protein